MITTKGFRDQLEMRRGIRNLHGSMFDMFIEPYKPLVPRDLRLGVEERTLYTGEVLTPLNDNELEAAAEKLLAAGCTAIAVCFLHSYANGENELRAKRLIQAMAPSVYVTTSHEILPVWREFERFCTAVVSAYIGPAVTNYARRLESGLNERGFRGRLLMMLANGLVQVVDECVDRAVYLLNSGPAAAPAAATYLGGLHGKDNLLSVDMGGTSFDVCVIKDGEIPTTTESWVGEHRVAIKMVDVPTCGAGGGSLARVDSLGLLRVGPQSAGADPGPAAYGKGDEATVTDADLVLGYIPADYFLGGEMKLDMHRAQQAVTRAGANLGMSTDQTAQAMFVTINRVMGNLITEVCTKKGHDVRDFTLVAGGGAGGIHAAAIAQQLSIPMVIVPRVAALMSAFGMFAKDLGFEYARSCSRSQKRIGLRRNRRPVRRDARPGAQRLWPHRYCREPVVLPADGGNALRRSVPRGGGRTADAEFDGRDFAGASANLPRQIREDVHLLDAMAGGRVPDVPAKGDGRAPTGQLATSARADFDAAEWRAGVHGYACSKAAQNGLRRRFTTGTCWSPAMRSADLR